MIQLMQIDKVIDVKTGVCVLLAEEEPESLELSGADTESLPDDYVFEIGSLLVTPSANYLAFEQGVFTKLEAGA